MVAVVVVDEEHNDRAVVGLARSRKAVGARHEHCIHMDQQLAEQMSAWKGTWKALQLLESVGMTAPLEVECRMDTEEHSHLFVRMVTRMRCCNCKTIDIVVDVGHIAVVGFPASVETSTLVDHPGWIRTRRQLETACFASLRAFLAISNWC